MEAKDYHEAFDNQKLTKVFETWPLGKAFFDEMSIQSNNYDQDSNRDRENEPTLKWYSHWLAQ